MSTSAIAHIRRVAPGGVGDDEIRAMLEATGRDPARVRAARHRVRPAAAAAPRHSIVLFHAARDDADLAPLAHLVGPGGPCARYVAAKDDADAHDGAPGTLTQLRHLLRRVAAAEANGTAGERATAGA